MSSTPFIKLLPAIGDENWGTKLLEALEEIKTRIQALENTKVTAIEIAAQLKGGEDKNFITLVSDEVSTKVVGELWAKTQSSSE